MRTRTEIGYTLTNNLVKTHNHADNVDMEFKEYLDVSLYNRIDDQRIYDSNGLYEVSDGVFSKVSVGQEYGDSCEHRCSWCSYGPSKISNIQDIVALHTKLVEHEKTMWSVMPNVAVNEFIANLLIKYRVVDFECNANNGDKVFVARPCSCDMLVRISDHTKRCTNEVDYELRDMRDADLVRHDKTWPSSCICKSCYRWSYVGDDERWVVQMWTYLDTLLYRLTAGNKDFCSCIDPWCLRRLWFCRRCSEHRIIDVVSSEGKEYSVCLECKVPLVVKDVDDDGTRYYSAM